MKKKLLLALVLTGCILTACATDIPLENGNDEVVAEYIADLLLRYGSDAPSKLVIAEPTVEPSASPGTVATPKPTATPTQAATPEVTHATKAPTETQSNDDQGNRLTANTTQVALSDIYGYANVNISVAGGNVYDSYPKEATAYCLTARKGYKLYVVTMSAGNTGSKKVDLNLKEKDVTYHLNVNGKWYSSLTTILENDAQFLETSVGAGKKTNFIVAFEIEDNVDLKDATMVLLQEKNSCEVKLN